MRMIDADLLSEAIHENVPAPYDDASWAKENYLAEIDAAPTVDAVPVVRCKDCKYHEDEKIGMVYCQNAFGGWVWKNWFCADGEREEGAE